jgi:hypothetical protein
MRLPKIEETTGKTGYIGEDDGRVEVYERNPNGVTSASSNRPTAQGRANEEHGLPEDAPPSFVGNLPDGSEGRHAVDFGHGTPQSVPAPTAAPATTTETPEGEPSTDWSRAQLDAYASSKGIDTKDAANKKEALELIEKG